MDNVTTLNTNDSYEQSSDILSVRKSLCIKENRSIFAVAIVSLIGIGALAYGVTNDHLRIAALQEKIHARNLALRQDSIQDDFLSLSQYHSGSSAGSSEKTCGESHFVERNVISDEVILKKAEDDAVLDYFSLALNNTVDKIAHRIALIETNYAAFNHEITNEICGEIDKIRA